MQSISIINVPLSLKTMCSRSRIKNLLINWSFSLKDCISLSHTVFLNLSSQTRILGELLPDLTASGLLPGSPVVFAPEEDQPGVPPDTLSSRGGGPGEEEGISAPSPSAFSTEFTSTSCAGTQSCPTLWDPMDSSPPGPDKITGEGCHVFLQGISQPQGWNPRLLH